MHAACGGLLRHRGCLQNPCSLRPRVSTRAQDTPHEHRTLSHVLLIDLTVHDTRVRTPVAAHCTSVPTPRTHCQAICKNKKYKTVNTDVACGAADDWYYFSPWRAPGAAPVFDSCGMAGGLWSIAPHFTHLAPFPFHARTEWPHPRG
jgi:hypothetical protein